MRLDVRVKLLLLLFANYLLLNRLMDWYEWAFVGMLLLLFVLANRIKKAVIYAIIFVTFYVLEHFVMQYAAGDALSFLSVLSIGGRLMLPCFMAGSYLLSTSTSSELIHGMRKWHVPEAVLLTFVVMMRFLPTIGREYRMIRQSLKLRGIFISSWDIVRKPVQFYEYVTVPLIMSATRTAQDLTIAALTKAVGSTQPRTEYAVSTWKWYDWTMTLMMVLFVVVMEWRKWL